tara:strand:+ start:573 stop:788 length:216 start_codon:yes stop_codon:yes gene_type:complete
MRDIVSDTHIALAQELKKVIAKEIDKHYPHPYRDKDISDAYAEEILDYAFTPLAELSEDIVAAYESLPDEV